MNSQHPGAIASGLFANMVVVALDGSYGYNIDPLTDQEILQNAGLGPQSGGPTYFDLIPYLVHQHDHVAPSSTLDSIGGTLGPDGVYTTPATITISTRDNRFGSGVSALQYSLDGGQTWRNAELIDSAPSAGAAYGTDWEQHFQFSLPGNGAYDQVVYRATDWGGNVETAQVLPTIKIQLSGGGLDPAFGTGGAVISNLIGPGADTATSVALEPDGRVVVAVMTYDGAGNLIRPSLARYNADGTPDTSFGSGGRAAIDITPSTYEHGIAVQGDGKILVVGHVGLTWVNPGQSLAVERFNADGSRDATFGTDGIMTTRINLASYDDAAAAVAIQSDGKIVVAGTTSVFHSPWRWDDFALVRYNSDGTLDTAFGTGGEITTDFYNDIWGPSTSTQGLFNNGATDLAIQPDGKIVVVGNVRQSSSFSSLSIGVSAGIAQLQPRWHARQHVRPRLRRQSVWGW